MVTSPYEWKILEFDDKPHTTNQLNEYDTHRQYWYGIEFKAIAFFNLLIWLNLMHGLILELVTK